MNLWTDGGMWTCPGLECWLEWSALVSTDLVMSAAACRLMFSGDSDIVTRDTAITNKKTRDYKILILLWLREN